MKALFSVEIDERSSSSLLRKTISEPQTGTYKALFSHKTGGFRGGLPVSFGGFWDAKVNVLIKCCELRHVLRLHFVPAIDWTTVFSCIIPCCELRQF